MCSSKKKGLDDRHRHRIQGPATSPPPRPPSNAGSLSTLATGYTTNTQDLFARIKKNEETEAIIMAAHSNTEVWESLKRLKARHEKRGTDDHGTNEVQVGDNNGEGRSIADRGHSSSHSNRPSSISDRSGDFFVHESISDAAAAPTATATAMSSSPLSSPASAPGLSPRSGPRPSPHAPASAISRPPAVRSRPVQGRRATASVFTLASTSSFPRTRTPLPASDPTSPPPIRDEPWPEDEAHFDMAKTLDNIAYFENLVIRYARARRSGGSWTDDWVAQEAWAIQSVAHWVNHRLKLIEEDLLPQS